MTLAERKKELANKEKSLLGTVERNTQTEQIKKENTLQSKPKNLRKFLWIGGITIGLAALIALIFIYRSKKAKNKASGNNTSEEDNIFKLIVKSELGKTLLSLISTYAVDYLSKRTSKEKDI